MGVFFRNTIIILSFYFIFCLTIPSLLRLTTFLESEWIRKFQHISFSVSIFFYIELFDSWSTAIFSCITILLITFTFLNLIGKTQIFTRFMIARNKKSNELKRQMLSINLIFCLLIIFYWNFLDIKHLIPVVIMAWGFGDAAAAVLGKAFGKKVVSYGFVDGSKTYVGFYAMWFFSCTAILITLVFYCKHLWRTSIYVSIILGLICAIVEVFSQKGWDTITIPLAAGFFLLPLIKFSEMWCLFCIP